MKQLTLPSGQYLFVEVPEGAKQIKIDLDGDLSYRDESWHLCIEKLPPGLYELIGKGDEIGEEVAHFIVEPDCPISDPEDIVNVGYKDYETRNEPSIAVTATASLVSLITSHGFKPSCCVILKKK